MSGIERELVWQEVGKIVVAYPLLECDRAARAAETWLKQRQIPHKILKLRTQRRSENFIVSRRYGLSDAITENGTHYGVEVFDRVFDNLSETGLTRGEWLADFVCPSGQFSIEELEALGG